MVVKSRFNLFIQIGNQPVHFANFIYGRRRKRRFLRFQIGGVFHNVHRIIADALKVARTFDARIQELIVEIAHWLARQRNHIAGDFAVQKVEFALGLFKSFQMLEIQPSNNLD